MKNGLENSNTLCTAENATGTAAGNGKCGRRAALALAAEESCKNAAENAKNIMEIKGYIASELLKSIRIVVKREY